MELSQIKQVSPTQRMYLWIMGVTLVLGGLFVWADGRGVGETAGDRQVRVWPAAGVYGHDIFVELEAGAEGTLLYRLDGRQPLPGMAQIYTRPLALVAVPGREQVVVVRARLQTAAGELGEETTAVYLLGEQPALPVVVLMADPDDLFSLDSGIYTNPRAGGRDWERTVTFTYFPNPQPPTPNPPLTTSAGLRIHGDTSRAYAKKSFRLHFRDAYGNGRLDYAFFPDSDVVSFDQLVLHAGGQDVIGVPHNWTLLRNVVAYGLAREIDADAAPHNRPVLLYLNAEFWGIYYLGERPDEAYIADHFGITEAALLDTPEHLERLDLNPAARAHWDNLMAFVETHDLSDSARYAYVQTQIDLDNFLDYHIINIYFANDDFNKNNIRQFRSRGQGGRWTWLLWDVDHSFGYSPTSPVDANTVLATLQEEHFEMTARYTLLFRKLLENPDFYNRFLTRTADLLNTVLAPERVQARIEREAALIRPYIPREIARWSVAEADWEASVQEMLAFAGQRPEVVRLHMRQAFEIPADKRLTIEWPAEGGRIFINGWPVEEYAQDGVWQGAYFNDSRVVVTAEAAPGYAFAGWGEGYAAEMQLTLTMAEDVQLRPRFQR